jgi:hypothetical protein
MNANGSEHNDNAHDPETREPETPEPQTTDRSASEGPTGTRQQPGVPSGDDQEGSSLTAQSLGLRWLSSKRLLGILSSLVVIAGVVASIYDVGNFGGAILNVVVTQEPTEEIERLLVTHYEEVGNHKYKEAFADYGRVEQKRQGGFEGYKDWLTNWCPPVDADVGQPEVNSINGDKATATVSVHYQHKCGKSPATYASQAKYVWNLSKVNGVWKLAERDQETVDPVYAHYPEEVDNQGPKYSKLSGGSNQGEPGSVRTSNTAVAGLDACGDEHVYAPANTVDGKPDTTWEVAGTGVGQWIELDYKKPISVNRVGIIPGYAKIDPCDGTDRFYQLYTVRKAEIKFSDGSIVETRTFDRKPAMQFTHLPNTERTSSVRITILATYPPKLHHPDGSTYDTLLGKAAISEIQVRK